MPFMELLLLTETYGNISVLDGLGRPNAVIIFVNIFLSRSCICQWKTGFFTQTIENVYVVILFAQNCNFENVGNQQQGHMWIRL